MSIISLSEVRWAFKCHCLNIANTLGLGRAGSFTIIITVTFALAFIQGIVVYDRSLALLITVIGSLVASVIIFCDGCCLLSTTADLDQLLRETIDQSLRAKQQRRAVANQRKTKQITNSVGLDRPLRDIVGGIHAPVGFTPIAEMKNYTAHSQQQFYIALNSERTRSCVNCNKLRCTKYYQLGCFDELYTTEGVLGAGRYVQKWKWTLKKVFRIYLCDECAMRICASDRIFRIVVQTTILALLGWFIWNVISNTIDEHGMNWANDMVKGAVVNVLIFTGLWIWLASRCITNVRQWLSPDGSPAEVEPRLRNKFFVKDARVAMVPESEKWDVGWLAAVYKTSKEMDAMKGK